MQRAAANESWPGRVCLLCVVYLGAVSVAVAFVYGVCSFVFGTLSLKAVCRSGRQMSKRAARKQVVVAEGGGHT